MGEGEDRTAHEERAAAEDLRRQLQERSAQGVKGVGKEERLRWLDENQQSFAEFASVSWGSAQDPDQAFAAFKQELESVPLLTPHDDPFTHSIVSMLCGEVESACRDLGVELRSGVAYGSTPSLEISAERYAVQLTDASVVHLSSGFIAFCSHISKVFALSLPHEADGDKLKVSFQPRLVLAKIGSNDALKQYWARVLGAYAFGSGPVSIEHRLVRYPASITRGQLLFAMERFAIAHEYGHHIGQHGRREAIGAGMDLGSIDEEFEADLFALSLDRYIGYHGPQRNLLSASGAAAVLLLKCQECVRRIRQVFLTGDDAIKSQGTHPVVSERVRIFDSLDEQVSEGNRTDFRKMRSDFGAIVDIVYAKLRPLYIAMHRQGLRPLAAENESWLPR